MYRAQYNTLFKDGVDKSHICCELRLIIVSIQTRHLNQCRLCSDPILLIDFGMKRPEPVPHSIAKFSPLSKYMGWILLPPRLVVLFAFFTGEDALYGM